ncbi:phage tail length tape measure family protein [Methylobacterium sp. WL64]|uniref:phage tail length tape measure family protein n=1 Tax=Methylobacterium sp. WL64 TaxID=2603894 RepID=UPI00164FECE9|nr:phage tail length tape measure family protein [Methylobacterium sp. WL64]
MADLATLSLEIDSRPAVDATTALDRFAQSARGAGQASDTLAATSGKSVPALQSAAAAATMAAVGMDKHTRAANENARAMGLSANELRNLSYQINDVATMALSGASAFQIMATQGGQLAQIAQGANGGLKGIFEQAATAAGGLASRVGLVSGAIGAGGAVLATGAAALMSYRAGQEATEKALYGVGRASGATVGSINEAAKAAAASGGISVASARETAAAFAATGRITGEMYGDLTRVTKDYAFTTGQDATAATAALAAAFSDPVKGAQTLNAQLGLLDASTEESIRRLDAQGDRLGAQQVLFKALSAAVENADSKLGFFGRQWQQFTTNTSNEIQGIGSFIDKGFGGGAAEERLATLQGQLDFRARNRGVMGGVFAGAFDFDTDTIKSQIADVQKEIDEAKQKSDRAQSAQRSQAVMGLVRSLMPEQQSLQTLQDQATRLRAAISQPVKFGLDTRALADVESAFERISRGVRSAQEDVERYGTSATAAMVRSAEFANRMVGATPLGRGVADAQRTYEENARSARLDPNGRSAAAINSDYAARLSDPNLDVKDARDLVAARERELKAARELEGLQRVRDLSVDSTQRATTSDLVQRGGAFARAPADIQQQVLAAAAKFPTVPPEILAAIGEKENNFRLTGATRVLNKAGQPATTAYGFGQITDDAETDIRKLPGMGGFDKRNPGTAVEGTAAYLSQRLKWVNGDMVTALDGYGTGKGYGLDVIRRAGQLGDVSPLGQAKEQDQRNRALEEERKRVALNSQLLGVNGEKLDAATRFQQALNQAMAQGVEITPQYRAELQKNAEGMAAATRALTGTQAGAALAFDREQLGRSASEQRVYASARSYFGDTSTDASKAYIGQATENAQLTEARQSLTSATQGFAADLLHGKNAAQAFGGALDQIGGRLMNSVLDKAIGSLFSDKVGGGILSSIFGHADGGLISGPGGPREDRVLARLSPGEFVVNARSASANMGLLHAINRGDMPKFADGGPVAPTMPDLGGLPAMPAAPEAAAASAGAPVAYTHAPTYNITPASGVTPAQLTATLESYDRESNRTLLSRMDMARRRYG